MAHNGEITDALSLLAIMQYQIETLEGKERPGV
jgi:hypothetical protein